MLYQITLTNFKTYVGTHVIGPLSHFLSIVGPNGSGKSVLFDAIGFACGWPDSRVKNLVGLVTTLARNVNTCSVLLSFTLEQDNKASCVNSGNIDSSDLHDDSTPRLKHFKRTVSSRGTSTYVVDSKTVSLNEYMDALRSIHVATLPSDAISSLHLFREKYALSVISQGSATSGLSPARLAGYFGIASGADDLAKEYSVLRTNLDSLKQENTTAFTTLCALRKRHSLLKAEGSINTKYTSLTGSLQRLSTKQALLSISTALDDALRFREEGLRVSEELSSVQGQISLLEKSEKTFEKQVSKVALVVQKQQKIVRMLTASLDGELQPNHASLQAAERLQKRRIAIAEDSLKRYRDISSVNSAEERRLSQRIQILEEELGRLFPVSSDTDAPTPSGKLMPAKYYETDRLFELENPALVLAYKKAKERFEDEERTVETLRERLQGRREELAAIEAEHRQASQRLGDTDARTVQQRKAIEGIEAEVEQLKALRVDFQQRRAETQLKLATLREVLDTNTVNDADLRHQRSIIDAVSLLKLKFKNVYGLVADLFTAKDAANAKAVELALGRFRDAVVTADFDTCRDCITDLRLQRKATLAFLPNLLVKINPGEIETERLAARTYNEQCGADCIVHLLDTINHDSSLGRVASFLCRNTFLCIVADESAARAFAWNGPKRRRVIMRSGLVFQAGGAVSCDFEAAADTRSDQKGFGKAITAAELAKMEAQAVALHADSLACTKKLEDLQEEIIVKESSALPQASTSLTRLETLLSRQQTDMLSKGHDIDILRKDITNLTHSLKEHERAMVEAHTDLSKASQEYHDSRNACFLRVLPEILQGIPGVSFDAGAVHTIQDVEGVMQTEGARLLQANADKATQLAIYRDKLRALTEHNYEADIERTSTALQKLRAECEDLSAKVDAASKALSQHKLELERATTELTNTTTDLEAARTSLASCRSKLALLAETQGESQRRSALLSGKVVGLVRELASVFENVNLEQTILPLQNVEDDAMAQNASLQAVFNLATTILGDNTQALSEDMLSILTLIQDLKIDFSGIKGELARIRQAINTRLALEGILKDMRSEAQTISTGLASLIPNMSVSAELESLSAQVDAQKKKVAEIRENLNEASKAFEVVAAERRRLFTKCFVHVSETISDIYSGLTRGNGTASLTLNNPVAPWSDGAVDYLLIPPADSFRNINQLSGGEHTCALLALLLALHSYRRCPFLLLDEVDSALDANNLQLVASYLRTQAGVQVICISHKSTFFSCSDALLGVARRSNQGANTFTLNLAQYD